MEEIENSEKIPAKTRVYVQLENPAWNRKALEYAYGFEWSEIPYRLLPTYGACFPDAKEWEDYVYRFEYPVEEEMKVNIVIGKGGFPIVSIGSFSAVAGMAAGLAGAEKKPVELPGGNIFDALYTKNMYNIAVTIPTKETDVEALKKWDEVWIPSWTAHRKIPVNVMDLKIYVVNPKDDEMIKERLERALQI